MKKEKYGIEKLLAERTPTEEESRAFYDNKLDPSVAADVYKAQYDALRAAAEKEREKILSINNKIVDKLLKDDR